MCIIGLDDDCWLSHNKLEENLAFIYFTDEFRARIYIFSAIFRRGIWKGRAHVSSVYDSCMFLKKIHGAFPPVTLDCKQGPGLLFMVRFSRQYSVEGKPPFPPRTATLAGGSASSGLTSKRGYLCTCAGSG